MRVAVFGATGVSGSAVVSELVRRGHDVVAVSRSGRVPAIDAAAGPAGAEPAAGPAVRQRVRGAAADVATGSGLAGVVATVRATVDATNLTTLSRRRAVGFFARASQNLVAAGAGAGDRHHVVLSIVGIDGVPWGYYEGKVAHEQAARGAGRLVSVVRATQFHDFPGQVVTAGGAGSVVVVPRMRLRPVAVQVVAATVVDRLERGPVGHGGAVDRVGGPREEWLPDLVRRWCAFRGLRRRVLPVGLPGAAGRAMRDGTLCPPDVPAAGPTWHEWLVTQPRTGR